MSVNRQQATTLVRLVLTGSRHLTDLAWITQAFRTWWRAHMVAPGSAEVQVIISEVFHGDGTGLDRTLGRHLESQGYEVIKIGAAWDVHQLLAEADPEWSSHKAGPERNEAMLLRAYMEHQVDYAPRPIVVAFPSEDSRGTWHAVGQALALGLQVGVIPYPEPWDALEEACVDCLVRGTSQRTCECIPTGATTGRIHVTSSVWSKFRRTHNARRASDVGSQAV